MFNFIRKPGIPASEDKVLEIEKKYAFRFPDILRDYYLTNDNARTHSVDIECSGEEYNVARLLELDAIVRLFDDWDFSTEYVPFASDWGDDIYCWRVSDAKVFVIYTDSTDYDHVIDSVEQFIELMENAFLKEAK